MKFTTKSQKKSIYSPISPEYSPISADESSSSHTRRKIDKNHKKRADDREFSRRVHKVDKYGRNRDRYDSEERSKDRRVREERNRERYERSRDKSEKYDCNVRSRHRSCHHKHDRHRRDSRRDHKRSDRSEERSRKRNKSKHKKHQKKRKHSSTSSSDEDLNSSSFISEILKNKKTKNSEKVLDEVKKTITNELNDENVSYTPPLRPHMTKTRDEESSDDDYKKISKLKQYDLNRVIKSNEYKSSLDENNNFVFTPNSEIAQKSNIVPKSTVNSVVQAKNDQKVKASTGDQTTKTCKPNDNQTPAVSNENLSKKKGVLDLPMPPGIDISAIPSPTQISENLHQKSNEVAIKSVPVSIPIARLIDSKAIEPIIAANFENSQLKKGVISHPPELLPQPKEKPVTDHGEHFEEMQKHLQTGAIFTPFDQKGTSPVYAKPARPSIVKQPSVTITRFKNKSFEKYKVLEQVGKGTYGKVFKAIDLDTEETVAMKYIKVEHETEGFPITCLREIKILRQLDHPNVIKLKDIVFRHEKNSTYLVFDYMNHDLLGLRINSEMDFDEYTIFFISQQLLEGINYCHKHQIIHRDLKLSNILVNNKGQVKICDFGLSRMWTVNRPYTNKVISLWYRPIELLLGEEMYGPPVDIWSIGCIIYEMFRRQPLFNYSTELEIVNAIFQLCGTPEYNMWPEVKRLPKYKLFKPSPRMRNLKNTLFPTLPPSVIDLVDQMLALNPDKRITAEDALKSNWVNKMEKAEKKPLKLPRLDSLEMQARGY
ncbi:cyclin-dependent kinase 12-like [Chironomus tepperi]|uniref:cyclin-dependent kinase 12-like n=1 Tax=Chironomus tepperi TaxID=113505 RepID=UPI00391F8E8F